DRGCGCCHYYNAAPVVRETVPAPANSGIGLRRSAPAPVLGARQPSRCGFDLEKIGLVLRHRGRYHALEANRSTLAGDALMLNAIENYLTLCRARDAELGMPAQELCRFCDRAMAGARAGTLNPGRRSMPERLAGLALAHQRNPEGNPIPP